MSSRPVTAADAAPAIALAGLAGIAGGTLHAVKGLVLLAGGPDLSFVPAMMILFAVGLLGLAARIAGGGRRDRLVGAGVALAAAAIVAGIVAAAYQAAGIAPEHAGSPAGVRIAYAAGTLGILLSLIALGGAAHAAATFAGRWRALPLVAGIVWFPLEALTAFTPDGVGLLAAGLVWVAVGYTVLGAPVRRVQPDDTG